MSQRHVPSATFEDLDLGAQYRTGERDPVAGFYRPCLALATGYARAVGYFRSSIYAIIGDPLIAFARRGGSMRLICSPSITDEDAAALEQGYAQRDEVIGRSLARDIDAMLANEAAGPNARVLATLIKCGSLDVRIAVKANARGIYHEKLGVFVDVAGSRVSFLGSANETWSAWHAEGNHETIEVFRETNPADVDRVRKHANDFERLWNGEIWGLETLPFPEAQRERLIQAAATDLDELEVGAPTHGGGRTPQKHQLDAIAAWEAAGSRGVLEHATGSGKTFTAITVIKKHIESGEPAVVLVPSRLLLEQWRGEIESELPDATVLMVGGGHAKWKAPGRLRAHLSQGIGMKAIVLATMQSAAAESFLREAGGGAHVLLVADEVHQIGSPHNARSMAIRSGPTLGLSATPTRYGDPVGTAAIFERFGSVVPPAITLQDAIRAGRLVDYEYFPHPVRLEDDEAEAWNDLTRQISLEMGRQRDEDGGQRKLSERAKLMLIRRSRIAKKARAKPGLAAEVINREFRPGQAWLVYCEDIEQLGDVRARLSMLDVSSIEYHSGMVGDRDATLDWFRVNGGVLVSIKCLDEGVDIPAVSHALILASSQNPRQFIQRRGRVLRKSKGKHIAVIHDAIVVPTNLGDEPEQTSLLRGELVRAVQFAESAVNKGAGAQLRAIALDLGIEIHGAEPIGVEEDDDDE